MRRFILSSLFCLCVSFSVRADVRYEADVHVDVTAETVTQAKEQAMVKAVRDGLNEVVLNVSTMQSLDVFDELNDNQLQHFVSGIMVLMEKSSDVRYIADLRVSINENVLKAYLQENGLPFVVSEEQDVLAIPLLEKADGTLDLWGDDNVWWQAFQERRGIRKGNLNIHNIEKNLGNITTVEADRIFDMTDIDYHDLVAFNNVSEIYVLKYSLKDNKLYVKSFPERSVSEADITGISPAQAIDVVLPFFKDNKKAVAVMEGASLVEQKIEMVYSYSKLGDWLALKALLEGYLQAGEVNVVSMVNKKVHFSFIYSGVWEKLQTHLAMNGYNLRNEGGYYAVY